jgi:glutamate formiminotransferase
MNLTDYRTTPILRVFEHVSAEAERLGTTVAGSEIVGLVPQDALPDAAVRSWRLLEFSEDKVLEINAKKKLGDKSPFGGGEK